MRIRRLAQRARSSVSRKYNATDYDGRAIFQITQPTIQRPTAASPLHPSAFYYEYGMYKYGTGMIALSPALQQRLRSSNISLKVYSTEPVDKKNVKNILGNALRTSNYVQDLQSGLNQLFHLAASVYSSNQTISNIVFQIFERHHQRFDRHRTTSVTRNRPWTLLFQLYRHVSGISMPYCQLAIASIYIGKRCTIQGRNLDTRPLSIEVHFHVKPSALETETAEHHARVAKPDDRTGPIQPLVDQILSEVLRSVRGLDFDSDDTMLLQIRRAALAYLRSSSLAPLVDFHHLDLELQTLRKDRFVTNTFLNADGTERDASKDYEDLSQVYTSLSTRLRARQVSRHSDSGALMSLSPAEPANQNTMMLGDMLPRVLSETRRELSAASQARTGISHIDKVSHFPNRDRSQQCDQIMPPEIFKIFDSLCVETSRIGLASLAHATTLMASKFRDLSARLDTIQFPCEISPSRPSLLDTNTSIMCSVNNGVGWFEIRLPTLVGVEFSISQTPMFLRHCRAILVGKYREDAPAQNISNPQQEISTADELNILTQMATTVMEGLAKGIKFDAPEAVPTLLAEGLLRTVRFLSPNITLEGVRVDILLPADSPLGHCEIRGDKWRQDNLENVSHGVGATTSIRSSATSNDVPVLGNTSTGPEEATQQDVSESVPELIASVDSEDHGPDSTRTGADDMSRPPRTPQLVSGFYLLDYILELSPMMQSTLGFDAAILYVKWKPEDYDSTARSISGKIRSLLENALAHVPSATLRSIHEVAKGVSKNLPKDPSLTLQVMIKNPDLPGDFEVMLDRGSTFATSAFFGKVASTSTHGRDFKVLLPGFFGLPFKIQQLPSTSRVSLFLHLRFEGTLDPEGGQAVDIDSQSQFIHMMRTVLDTIKPTLESTTFDSLDDLTDRLTSRLIDQCELFKSIINVHKIRLKTRIKEHSSGNDIQAAVSTKLAKVIVAEEEGITGTHGETDRKVFIALGSNLGDRLKNIEKACQEINKVPNTRILETSALYETAPMYVEDQDAFLNGVCQIKTTLPPIELLDELQAIEQRLGRVKTVDKGPRNIDLDILLYQNKRVQTDRLTIPHPLMLEREFVLRPLCDLPARIRRPPDRQRSHGEPYAVHLERLIAKSEHPIYPVLSLAQEIDNVHIGSSKEHTRIMSILNLTPDSFSDGGLHSSTDEEQLTSSIKSQIVSGATIVDIGGQSSRPNAPDVAAEEEISRILPAIEAIKSMPQAANIAISVDTYRAAVAEAAVNAGAHIINDISAGMLDEDMLPTIARLGCTYIMMHMRGTPSTMMSKENCSYPDGLTRTIRKELSDRVDAAQAAGIYRWRIVLDPGIGFSKTADQNLELLRNFKEDLKQSSRLRNFAWLVGSSRKSFIGKVTGVEEPKERGWGTAATVTAAIQGGADIVRVHDAAEMSAVVKMADAMYRV